MTHEQMTDELMADEHAPLRDRLRELPVFPSEQRDFDTDAAPSTPYALLISWLEDAITTGVAQPHAMTLATADASGHPSARTLLLKDVVTDHPAGEGEPSNAEPAGPAGPAEPDDTQEGLWFATLSDSPKGEDLAMNEQAALAFYWREQGRQIRVTGSVQQGPREVSEQDFLARGFNARALALTGEQSAPMPGPDDVRRSIQASREFLAGNPLFVPAAWIAYRLVPIRIEFWQATAAREQVRLLYTRPAPGAEWSRSRLWP